MSLPGSSTMAAEDVEKAESAAESARVLAGPSARGFAPGVSSPARPSRTRSRW